MKRVEESRQFVQQAVKDLDRLEARLDSYRKLESPFLTLAFSRQECEDLERALRLACAAIRARGAMESLDWGI